MAYTEAVSYTHLDVYKRQQLGASMGMVIPLAAAYNMNLEDLAASYALPVSYTHLNGAGNGDGSHTGNAGATYSYEQAEEIANARAGKAERAALAN